MPVQKWADLEYIRILHLSATTMQCEVEAALAGLLEEGQVPSSAGGARGAGSWSARKDSLDAPGPARTHYSSRGRSDGFRKSRLSTGGLRSESRPDICLKWWLPRRKRGNHEEELIQYGLGSWIDEVRIHPGIQVRS